MSDITLTQDQYAGLLNYAAEGALGFDLFDQFLQLRQDIDTANSITRFTLMIRWQSIPNGPPTPVAAGGTFPGGKMQKLELTRRPTKQDVLDALAPEIVDENLVMVTPDAQGVVGWSSLNVYFP